MDSIEATPEIIEISKEVDMCLKKAEPAIEQRTIGYKLMFKDKDGILRFIITGESVELGVDLVADEVDLKCEDGSPYRGGFHYLDEEGRDRMGNDAARYERAMKSSVRRSREQKYEMEPFTKFDINEAKFVMATCEVSDTHTQGGFWDDNLTGYVCSKLRVLSYEDVKAVTLTQIKQEV